MKHKQAKQALKSADTAPTDKSTPREAAGTRETREDATNAPAADWNRRLDQLEARLPPASRRSTAVQCLTLVAVGLLTWNVGLLWSQMSAQSAASEQAAFWELCHAGTTPAVRTSRFLQLVESGNVEWRSAILQGLDLAGTDLSGRNIRNARFDDCDLSHAQLFEAQLNNAIFNLCNCEGAVFGKADLRNSSFFKAQIRDADFRGASLQSASLEQCRAKNASFVTAEMGECFLAMADLSGADLTGADLTGADLTAAKLIGANLALSDFSGAFLDDTDLSDSNWWRARGLGTAEMQRLALKFPPSPSAEESRRRDFRIWISNQRPPDEN
ncbi:MAG: pentapeptide repeat-containing protein [Planctomycetaceae bacterium]|nr:pentapeptide repeat-containing protein [Planctomycetaceae bacterium]